MNRIKNYLTPPPSKKTGDVRNITKMIPAYILWVDENVKGVQSLLSSNNEDFEEHFETTQEEFLSIIKSGRIDEIILDANIKEFRIDASLEGEMLALKNMRGDAFVPPELTKELIEAVE